MFDSLNVEQQAAVDHTGSPLLIVAGAGTGKTKTLAARVCRIIEDGADPSRVLLLTFTRRAATEMLARVAAVSTDRAASRVWGGTFHSTANRLLRNFGQSAGLSPGFTVLDQTDATDLMGIVRTDEGFGERGKRFPRKETVAGIYSRMVSSQAKLADVLEIDYPWCADHGEELKTIFTAYTARKRTHQVLDYDDLLLFWRGLTASTIGDAMRDLFDHVLIDEYQDTNPIQADIVRGMCRPDTDLCAVGDDAQAIYGFRAATVANMWEFADHFPGATRVTLEQNYRSTMPILAVANAVLGQSDEHFAKELWSARPQGVTPVLRTHHDESAQSASVATAVLDARERGMDLREQAVLFRAGHHADGLELELTRRDIPYVKYGGLKYLESAHVKDLLALLRILDNPADQLAWHRVLATMEGVGPATVRRLSDELGIEREDDDALARFIDGAGRTPSAAEEQALELRTAFAECAATEPAITPAQQVDRLKQYCALVFPNRYDDPAARVADIDQLASTAAAYTTRSRFLTELTLDPPSKTSDQAGPPHLDDDWLTLSTIHSAKGLEWRSVHLIHAADGNMPSEMALGDEHGLAEELRLMYVALTRAKDELTVNFPLRFHVNRYATDDRHVYAQLSRFVDPVRELFDEETDRREIDLREADAALAGATVGVADEVDTLLASLWD
ncbi:MAG: ATP-dependent helicase [Acidimicrobiales bacterium]|nr:ATP-dependent helicase [Acidimicrobiales bacterium]